MRSGPGQRHNALTMLVASGGHGRRVDVAALPAQHLDLELERLDLLGLDLDQLHQVLPLAPGVG